ncbi:hypothetical protein [Herbidospora sp. RD11066]
MTTRCSTARSTAAGTGNVVERCFNRLKRWRGIATRYDKLARNYQAGITLVSTLLWIHA